VLIRGGTVVDAYGERVSDVRVASGGTIAEVGPELALLAGEELYDAAGRLVIPGGVDVHTHLNLPVGEVRAADDFASGTRAAALGGAPQEGDRVRQDRRPSSTLRRDHPCSRPRQFTGRRSSPS
jgi:dihydropyrimidinase